MKKKIFCFLLTLSMIFTMFVGSALAEEADASENILYVNANSTSENTPDGTETNPYKTIEAAVKAAESMTGDVTITLLGNVEWETGAAHDSNPMISEESQVGDVTIDGRGEYTFVAKGVGVGAIRAANGSTLIFKDMKIVDESAYQYENGENAWEFTYLEFGGKTEFENVNFDDGVMFKGDSAVLKNCTFSGHNNDSSDMGDVTMYGAWVANGSAVFDNCTFSGTRGLKMHEQYDKSDISEILIDGCTFDKLSEKPGIAIGNVDASVIIRNCTFTDCQAGDGQDNETKGVPYMYETDTPVGNMTKFISCGNTVTANEVTEIKDKEHIWGDFVVTIEPTYTSEGEKEHTCEICGAVETEKIAKLVRPSSSNNGGSVVAEYKITVADTANGSVSIDRKTAESKRTVKVTVTPADGYKLEAVKVVDKKGNEIKLTAVADSAYTFSMPASDVTVTAEFAKKAVSISFVDVAENDYYYDAVKWAVENGITTGTSDIEFSPNLACTRAQAVTFLWRAAGCPKPQNSNMPFVDVAADAYYHDAVLWAVENQIAKGISDTEFGPDAECSREHIVTFLWRFEKCPDVKTAEMPFGDVAADAYFHDAVLWALENNITTGTDNNTFSPAADCTRAQIVTFMYRLLAE